MNDLFVKDKRSGIITSPTFSIHREKGESKDEWKFEIDEPTESSSDPNEFRTRRNFESNFLFKTLEKTDNSGNLDVFDDKGENVFHIEYGGDDSAMFIAQTHIPTGITKKIRALKSPDNQAVTAAINALPPYNRQQGSDIKPLVVPWRDINRILGAGISYSYPQSPISDRNTTADAPRSPKD